MALEEFRWHGLVSGGELVTFLEEFDRFPGPDGPMPKQTAHDAASDRLSLLSERVRREQIQDDVVIVAGVKGDVVALGLDHGADHVQRLIAIERRDFDGDDIFDLGKAPPECMERIRPPTAGWR